MARWTQLYDELAGPRYPALIAYAGLLTGDREAADALVTSALRRTFARPRRFDGPGLAEHEVRRAIVSGFLARAHGAGSAAPAADHEPVAEPSPRPAETSAEGDSSPGSNPYAPPVLGETPPPPGFGDASAEPARASAGVTPQTEEDRVRETVLTLAPRDRAVAVLRHHDSLTPGQISERLGLSASAVSASLQEVHAVVRSRLGIALPEDGLGPDGAGATEVTVGDHFGRT